MELLLDFGTLELVEALLSTDLNSRHLEGAAKFFRDGDFKYARKGELNLVPAALRKAIIEQAKKSQNHFTREYADNLFPPLVEE